MNTIKHTEKLEFFQRKPLFPLPRSYNEHFDIFVRSYNYPSFYAYINPFYFLMHFKVNCIDDYTSASISLTRVQYWFVGDFFKIKFTKNNTNAWISNTAWDVFWQMHIYVKLKLLLRYKTLL